MSTFSDDSNCLGCGYVCSTGNHCDPSIGCRGGSALTNCGGSCPAGTACTTVDLYYTYCLAQACGDAGDNVACSLEGDAGTCCGGGCVDLGSDDSNCGACGWRCAPGDICAGGACVSGPPCAPASQEPCLLPTTGIEGTCCDGVCQAQCSTTDAVTTCTAAAEGAQCLGATPGGNNFYGHCCAGTCLMTESDPANCGYCGGVCGGGTSCTYSICVNLANCPPGMAGPRFGPCLPTSCAGRDDLDPCPYGFDFYRSIPGTLPVTLGVCCGGRCVLPDEDPSNCGTCGNGCPSGICAWGACVPLASSNDCLKGCPAGELCMSGACVAPGVTPPTNAWCILPNGDIGFTCYHDGCVDLANDPKNCGACGSVCPAGMPCRSGSCAGSPCPLPILGSLCNPDAGGLSDSFVCCASGCTDITSDPQNCGACSHQCDGGQTCQVGTCQG